jgi:hypothetical protein
MSEIKRRPGMLEESEQLADNAKRLFQKSGRQYYFLALGSLWFDYISDSIQRYGG